MQQPAAFFASLRNRRCAGKLASLRDWPALPLLLLLLTLATVFLFSDGRQHFYRPWMHNNVTANHLAVAANLSAEHGFLRFYRRTLDADGAPAYVPYNRFPPGGYLLIRLSMMPFGDDLSAQILAARMLMLLFFAATAVLAYLSLCRLAGQRWIALAATLPAFSSSYWLYYNDMVATEIGLDLFGLMLCFHGMAIFVQDGRFRQLLAKTCIALLLGWHVLALLLPFVLLGLVKEAKAARSARRSLARSWLRSRYLALGVAALLFGAAMLGFNLANERAALNGQGTLADMPTVQSMLKRTGLKERGGAGAGLAWQPFLEAQLHRIGKMSVPYLFSEPVSEQSKDWAVPLPARNIALGTLVLCASLVGLAFARHRLLLATLILSGPVWTLPMRHNTAFHDFESLAYTGIALAFPLLALLGLRRLFGNWTIAPAVAGATLLFALSSWQMGRVGYYGDAPESHEALAADFGAIGSLTKGRAVFVPAALLNDHLFSVPGRTAANYYLAGSLIVTEGQRHFSEFVLSRGRLPGAALLTPNNRLTFLYERAAYEAQIDEMLGRIDEQAPLARSNFDLYAQALGRQGTAAHESAGDWRTVADQGRPTGTGRGLIYLRDACRPKDLLPKFMLHVFPAEEGDLPDARRSHGFDNLDFYFDHHGLRRGERCVAVVPLPAYNIRSIHTGQFLRSEQGTLESVWEASFAVASATILAAGG